MQIHAASGVDHVPFVRRYLSRAFVYVPRAPAALSIALVGDATMSRLHQQFLSIPGPTDVLTFELAHDGSGRVTEGEVVVCVPEARRQAKRHRTRVGHELLLYCLHGLLHLTGHDDRDDAAHRRMHREEDRILAAIGVGAVFAPPRRPERRPRRKGTVRPS